MAGLWALLRLPASFRGVPFVVEDDSRRRGRQIALHTYPFRDEAWPEDLGRSPRVTMIRGFVIGDDCDYQIMALEQACETAGPGQLVHPAIGTFSAVVLEFVPSCSARDGRIQTFEMTVVPYVARIYPVATADTQAQTQGFFGGIGSAIAKDFGAAQAALGPAVQQVSSAVRTIGGYVSQATSLVNSATSLAHLPAALVGNFGRFAGGGLAGGISTLGGGVANIGQAMSVVSAANFTVTRIGSGLNSLASRL